METDDRNLLRQYVKRHSQEAFAALVSRHLNLVYSVALRTVRSPQLAEDVAQSVFTDLARQAHRLAPDTILTAWLYQVTHRTAIDVVRHESRRQLREQVAHELTAMNATAADWTHVEPLLDEAMHALDDTDRVAVLLRYFENKTLHEVGETLGTSEDAAQKRVSRAVERLREFFVKRGVIVGAGGLTVVISANAVQAAPAGLAATISSAAALAGTTVAATTTATLTKVIAMTTLPKTLVTAAIVVTAGAGIYEAHQASTLRDQVQTLQQQQASLTSQLQQLQRERDDASNRLALSTDENVALKNDSAELLKFRAVLAAAQNGPTQSAAKSWLDRVTRLKQRLEQAPDAKIPELQLVTEKDWLSAAKGDLNTDVDYRRALSAVRAAGEGKVASMLKDALFEYIQAKNGQFPTDLGQLQPYFAPPVDGAVLQRWEIVPASTVKSFVLYGANELITQKAAVDDVFDTRFVVGSSGMGSSDFLSGETNETMMPVYAAYRAAHNGHWQNDTSELEPYITTPEQRTAFDKLILRESNSK